MKELISVLIPVYNVDRFIRKSIDSIRTQTYENIEIIIVDDCSTDSTYEILKEIAVDDDRVKLYKNGLNIGIAKTLNFALGIARGEFICRMDGDDIADRTKIEKQYLFLKNNPGIDLVGTNYILVDESCKELSRSNYFSSPINIHKIIKWESPVAHIWMTRKDIYTFVGPYRLAGVEDYDFLLRLDSMGYKMSNIKDYLYYVTSRTGNTISLMGIKQRNLINYALELYFERIRFGHDSYTIDEEVRRTSISNVAQRNFEKSNCYYLKFIKEKSFFMRLYYLFLSIVNSPIHQFSYIYRRLICKLLKKITSDAC